MDLKAPTIQQLKIDDEKQSYSHVKLNNVSLTSTVNQGS
jgi:hypothetical protein